MKNLTLKRDETWINDGLTQVRNDFSNVLMFETSDPERAVQLRSHFAEQAGSTAARLALYDPWNGLRPVRETDVTNRRESAPVSADLDLASILNELDRRMKDRATVALIQNPNPSVLDRSVLQNAIRTWSHDSLIRAKKSLVIVLSHDLSEILDEHTISLGTVRSVPPASEAERESILTMILGRPAVGTQRARLMRETRGLNLQQTAMAFSRSMAGGITIDPTLVGKAKAAIVSRDQTIEVVEKPEKSFEDIGGYADLKHFFRDSIIRVLREAERAAQFRVRMPRGILLFGPPRTGKTQFAKALASELDLPFVALQSESIFASHLGESGQRLRSAIRQIDDMSPAVVFVDEIDRFGKRIQPTDSAGQEVRRVFSSMLEWLGSEGRTAIVVGATNRPGDLDEAFLAPGRFDYRIPVLYPDARSRAQIILLHLGLAGVTGDATRRPPMTVTSSELEKFVREEMVAKTELHSGGDLEELVQRAKKNAFLSGDPGLQAAHLGRALGEFAVNSAERIALIRRSWEDVVRYCTESRIVEAVRNEWRYYLPAEARTQEHGESEE